MYILAGLGNPGRDYLNTRHNIGFMFLDYLAARHNLLFRDCKWQALLVKDVLWGKQVLLVKPQSYMNRSGEAVSQVLRYYNLEPENLVVVYDDVDLPMGRVKIVTNRGAGGHNGIRSIIEHLGGTRNFIRIRVGIDRPQPLVSVASHVLSRLSVEEQNLFQAGLAGIEDAVRLVVEKGVNIAMNHVNCIKGNFS